MYNLYDLCVILEVRYIYTLLFHTEVIFDNDFIYIFRSYIMLMCVLYTINYVCKYFDW